jgi:hypothetical protein
VPDTCSKDEFPPFSVRFMTNILSGKDCLKSDQALNLEIFNTYDLRQAGKVSAANAFAFEGENNMKLSDTGVAWQTEWLSP